MKIRPLLIAILLSCMLISGCSKKDDKLCIAEQYGIAYAPLEIMKTQGYLEKSLPGITVEWKQFGGPTAIREGFASGDIDFGFMGWAPALIGVDRGMDWKIATGISSNDSALVTDRDDLHSLHDFSQSDRIAILSPGCTQHVLLSMLAEQQLGDPTALDNQIVAMSHPDAMNALLADTEIVAHFATPPYLGAELDADMHVIADGEEIVGEPFTFITGVAAGKLQRERPEVYQAILDALQKSIDYINADMSGAAELLAPIYEIDTGDLLAQMQYHGTIYSTRLEGIDTLNKAMRRLGFIEKDLSISDICYENVELE